MSFRSVLITLMLTAVAGAAHAAAPGTTSPAKAAASDTATFAMGCFWSAEYAFEGRPGVISVTSGFAGGTVERPSYEQVCAGGTGHLEAVNIVFDPSKTTYARLLDLFWHNIDPTQSNGQFCDRGEQYHTAVFARGPAQRRQAEDSKRAIEKGGVLKGAIVTKILPATPFYAAEDYHQDFFRKEPAHYQAYRQGCGRDRRLLQIWGKVDSHVL